ncbi:hypothetical protein [Salipiger thiooxidans]|uniref:hypothetical protein n=1 Tax=Salipiger thiooxidans TaxID=282683 RepID=UPI001CFB61A2|nr:hypothetical protein [Salipiger thiooxidans]
MNAETGTALAIPVGVSLVSLLQKEDALEAALKHIEDEARSHAPDLTSAKGRKAIASLAYSIARSKTALDDAGKEANADLRTKINAVDEQRRKVRERLDALKSEIRKPLDDWEAAEEKRLADHRAALAKLQDTGRAYALSPSAQIREILEEIEATETGPEWDEFQELAAAAKEKAIDKFNADLRAAEKREAEAEELARLRAAEEERKAKQEAERAERERIAQEKAEAAAAAKRLEERAANARAYINQIGVGLIGGKPQSFGILTYELESKLPPLIDDLGDHAPALHELRVATLASVNEKMERKRVDDAAAEDQRAKEAAETAAREAKEAERQRLAEEAKARDEAEAKRRSDEAHRNRILKEITEALMPIPRDAIPHALLDGRIPHVKVLI